MTRFAMLRVLAALFVLAPAVRAQGAPAPSTTVIVVRHAEKAAEPAADPPLTAAGTGRAELLAALVKDAGVTAILSTQFARTRNTVAPAAAMLGLTTETYSRFVADTILAKYRGKTVLIAGHSNTVPEIVAALGAPRPAAICDAGYDNLFIVTVPVAGAPTVVRLHYGVATACP